MLECKSKAKFRFFLWWPLSIPVIESAVAGVVLGVRNPALVTLVIVKLAVPSCILPGATVSATYSI